MKYIVILADGMADFPIESLGNKTPLEVAFKPNMDALASKGEMGLAITVPENLSPGSDVANLAIMGYNTADCYTGRSPLEAASIGVSLSYEDVTFRSNLVTLSYEENYADKTMLDYSSDEISTEEAHELMADISKAFDTDDIKFYGGTSYRHLMVHTNGSLNIELTPPHDISDKKITDYLPKGYNSDIILGFMEKSYEILKNHPINLARVERGLKPANSLWMWGQGSRPKLQNFYEKTGKRAGVISAVDLIKGIAKTADMQVFEVEGATGAIHTNFAGKAKETVRVLLEEELDFVYLHIESPDECGHKGDLNEKIHSIEKIDREVVGYIVDELNRAKVAYKILLTPDHPTPIALRTHVRNPVPFVIYNSTNEISGKFSQYSEKNAELCDNLFSKGYLLLDHFLDN